MAVADIGAGTGCSPGSSPSEVGPEGKVYAVDVSKEFLDHIAAQAEARGQTQIVTVRGTQSSTNLPAGSVDLVFLCDVYHHLEDHEKILARSTGLSGPEGVLVLVEFDRVEGKSSDFVLKHIRAGQGEFRTRDRVGRLRGGPRRSHGPQAEGEFLRPVPEERRVRIGRRAGRPRASRERRITAGRPQRSNR